jgi:hypothetical protein
MPKFSIDYSNLENKIIKKAFKLKDVQHRIEKVAFDVVKFKDGDEASALWQVQSADDGDYIIALYQDDLDEKEASSNPWEVSVNKLAGEIYVYYKGSPLTKFASSKIGIPTSELDKVEKYLPEKLAENKKLVNLLLNELSESAKKEALSKYPELF